MKFGKGGEKGLYKFQCKENVPVYEQEQGGQQLRYRGS